MLKTIRSPSSYYPPSNHMLVFGEQTALLTDQNGTKNSGFQAQYQQPGPYATQPLALAPVNLTVVAASPFLASTPTVVTCLHCQNNIQTAAKYEGMISWLLCGGLFIFG